MRAARALACPLGAVFPPMRGNPRQLRVLVTGPDNAIIKQQLDAFELLAKSMLEMMPKVVEIVGETELE